MRRKVSRMRVTKDQFVAAAVGAILALCLSNVGIIRSSCGGRSPVVFGLFVASDLSRSAKKVAEAPELSAHERAQAACMPTLFDKRLNETFQAGHLLFSGKSELPKPGVAWHMEPRRFEHYAITMFHQAEACEQRLGGDYMRGVDNLFVAQTMFKSCYTYYSMYAFQYVYWFMQRVTLIAPPDVRDFDEQTMEAYQSAMRLMDRIYKTALGMSWKHARTFNWNDEKEKILSRCVEEAASGIPTQACHPERVLKDFRLADWQVEDYVDMNWVQKDEADFPIATRTPYSKYLEKTEVSMQFATPVARLDVVRDNFLTKEDLASLDSQTRTCFDAFRSVVMKKEKWTEEYMADPNRGRIAKQKVSGLYIQLQRDTMPHCLNRTMPCYIQGQGNAEDKESTDCADQCDNPELKPCIDLHSSREFRKFKIVQRDVARAYAAQAERIKGRDPPQAWEEAEVSCSGFSVVYDSKEVSVPWHEHDMTGFGAASTTGLSGVFYLDVAPGSQIYFADPRGQVPFLNVYPDNLPKVVRPEWMESVAMPVYSGSILMWPSYLWHAVPDKASGRQVTSDGDGVDEGEVMKVRVVVSSDRPTQRVSARVHATLMWRYASD